MRSVGPTELFELRNVQDFYHSNSSFLCDKLVKNGNSRLFFEKRNDHLVLVTLDNAYRELITNFTPTPVISSSFCSC